MLENEKKFRYIFIILVCAALVFILAVIPVSSTRVQLAEESPDLYDFNENWYRVDGDTRTAFRAAGAKTDTKRLVLTRTVSRAALPGDADTLCFVTNNAAVEVLLDGKTVYRYGTDEDLENGVLLGNHTPAVTLLLPEDGGTAELTVILSGRTKVYAPYFRIGTPTAVTKDAFRASAFTLLTLTSALIMILLLLLFSYFGRQHQTIPRSYLYLLAFIFIACIWTITDTPFLSLLGVSPGVISLLFHEAFLLMPIPFALFMQSTCTSCRKLEIWLCMLFSANFAVQNLLHFIGVILFPEMKPAIYFCLLVMFAVVVYQMICDYQDARTTQVLVRLIGFGVLVISAIVQFFISRRNPAMANTVAMQIGLIVFVLLYVVYLIRDIFAIAEEGYRADVYRSLAHTDSLTGVANRRALDEEIEALAAEERTGPVRLGCIVCDLNNMKSTNDTLGHAAGDALLRGFATCITTCFQGQGVPYRAGGDEFYIMFYRTEADMPTMLEKMDDCVAAYNEKNDTAISFARGAAVIRLAPEDTVSAIYQLIQSADNEMYSHKATFHGHPIR